MSDNTVFLTNGTDFIGPYLTGDMNLVKGKRLLAEADGGPHEVHAVYAATLDEARGKWAKEQAAKRK